MKTKINHIVYLIFCVCVSTFAQQLEFEHITDREGLIGTCPTSIYKDSHGYMWFGFFDGISKYDGYKFTNYTANAADPKTLSDNYIRCIYESKDSTLLIGLQYKGLCIYNRETDTFTRLQHNDKDPNSLINNYVLTITEDTEGNLWVGTRGGLDKFDLKKRTFSHYHVFPQTGGVVSAITQDKDNNLWMYGKGSDIAKFDPVSGRCAYFNIMGEISVKNTYYHGGSLICDRRNNLWIGTEKNGVVRYSINTGEKKYYNTSNKPLKSNVIFSIFEDHAGHVWMATDGAGLYLYDYKTDKLSNYDHDPSDPTSLSGNGVYCMYESDPGVVWVGVYASGINVYKAARHKFHSVSARGLKGKILSQKSVLSIAGADGSKVWLGTDGGGLNLFHPATEEIKVFTQESSKLSSNIITAIENDAYGNLWLGTFGKGVSIIHPNKTKTDFSSQVQNPKHKLRCDHVWSLLNTNNYMWVGLLNFGIERYNFNTNTMEVLHYDTVANAKGITEIKAILKDGHKRVWFASDISGLLCYDEALHGLKRWLHNKDDHYSLSDNDINDLFEDRQGFLWIATRNGGLNKLIDPQRGRFIHYTTRDGLCSNNVKSIQEDDHGNLWLSTNNGLSLFKVKECVFINFDATDGLISKEFNINSSFKSKNGYLYFGGTYGLNYFHPDSIKYNRDKPKIVLTDFKIFNTSLLPAKPYNGKMYLQKAVDLCTEITLTHEDYVFSIEFAALDLISPEKNKFAYRMKGFHDEWTHVDAHKRFATFTNLDPGTYEFQVLGCNNDGLWNDHPATMHITILPPWWETWWFKSTLVAALAMSLLGFYFWRIRSIKQRNRHLTREVLKRTQELLEQKNEIEDKSIKLEELNKTKDKFFSIIGHDLKGPVNALTMLTDMLSSQWDRLGDDKKRDYLHHIDRSSKQVKMLVHSLLEWARTQSGQVRLEPKVFTAAEVIQQNVELLFEQADQKKITFNVVAAHDDTLYADQNMVSTILRNIMGNAIKYTHVGGTISISSVGKDGKTQIRIADEGLGMSETTLQKLFSLDKGPSIKGTNKETGTGLGLIISQEFALMNGGLIWAESTLGKGSTFYVELPAGL